MEELPTRDHNAELLAEIRRRRSQHRTAWVGGKALQPHFDPLPSAGAFDQARAQGMLDRLIDFSSQPESWRGEGVVARTREEAIRLAKAQLERDVALVRTQPGGLPTLRGTPKQVAWATSIRNDYVLKNPDDKRRLAERSAAWWIDNRSRLS